MSRPLIRRAGRVSIPKVAPVVTPSKEEVRIVIRTFGNHLQRLRESLKLSEQQIQEILSVIPENIPGELQYEIIGLIHQIGGNAFIEFARTQHKWDLETIWNFPTLEKMRKKELIEAEILLNRPVEAPSADPCPNCHTKHVTQYSKQLRGADEPPTIIHHCQNCGYTWKS